LVSWRTLTRLPNRVSRAPWKKPSWKVLSNISPLGIGRLPVVSEESGNLVEVITRTDVIRAYNRAVELLSKSEPT